MGAETLIGDYSPGPEAPSKCKKGGAKETSGEEQWRRIGVSGLLSGRKLEEMTQ